MRKIGMIMRWELSKLFTNWRKAVTVFLLPAVLMMCALNLFPVLINYLTTGSFVRRSILVLDAPESFVEYTEGEGKSVSYTYEFASMDDYDREELDAELLKGRLIVIFSPDDFDKAVRYFFHQVSNGIEGAEPEAEINVLYDNGNVAMAARALQFETDVTDNYTDSLQNSIQQEYGESWGDIFLTDDFNPVTDIVKNRSAANEAASRVIPGIVVLLLYYCVYSLSCDMFAAERDRGFFNKLLLTPLEPRTIFLGKALAINVISIISALTTFCILFFSSWLNRSNDAMSLLPFGMLLTPSEILMFLLIIPPTAFFMTALCIKIVFSLEKMQDILVNLQFPLILLLAEFFLQMIRPVGAFAIEYIFPIHGSICALRDVFAGEIRPVSGILGAAADIIIGTMLILDVLKKSEGKDTYASSHTRKQKIQRRQARR